MDEQRLRNQIGRLASLSRLPPDLDQWVRDQGEDLRIRPVLPGSALNEEVVKIWSWKQRCGILVTVVFPEGDEAPRLEWLAVAASNLSAVMGCQDLPLSPTATVGDLLRVLRPGATMTLPLAGGGDGCLMLRQGASCDPIADEEAIESLRTLAAA